MTFRIISSFSEIKIMAVGSRIREIDRLRRVYGDYAWRKREGFAYIQLTDGITCQAELHWYEAHGVGKIEVKIKKIIE